VIPGWRGITEVGISSKYNKNWKITKGDSQVLELDGKKNDVISKILYFDNFFKFIQEM
jgi:hypothetical protein